MRYAEEIKSAVRMEDVFLHYGIEVNRAGFACCPFHNEETGSMKLYPDSNKFYCFGCHTGGSVLDFVMQYTGCTLEDAERQLNDLFGLGLDLDKKLTRAEQKDADRKARLRRLERERREKRHNALLADYDAALSRWVALDRAIINQGLQGNPDGLTDEYIYAIRHIDAAAYDLELADMALMEFEKSR